MRVLSALPPRPNRPDKWGRFGLGAFLNAGKNVGGIHWRSNELRERIQRSRLAIARSAKT